MITVLVLYFKVLKSKLELTRLIRIQEDGRSLRSICAFTLSVCRVYGQNHSRRENNIVSRVANTKRDGAAEKLMLSSTAQVPDLQISV